MAPNPTREEELSTAGHACGGGRQAMRRALPRNAVWRAKTQPLITPGSAPTPRVDERDDSERLQPCPHAESGRARPQRETSTVPPRREWTSATTASDH